MISRGLRFKVAIAVALCASVCLSLVASCTLSASAAVKQPSATSGHAVVHAGGKHPPKISGPPVVPVAAVPLLVQAVRLAAEIVADQHAVMAAAERFDEQEIALGQAQQRVVVMSRALAVVDGRLASARAQLRQATIEVYVTDLSSSGEGDFLTSSFGQEQTVSVYSGMSLDRLNQAAAGVAQLVNRLGTDRAARVADVSVARLTLVAIAATRATASAASETADSQLATVERRLTALAGAAKAAALLEMVSGQAKYKGPRLGGKDAGKLASSAKGLEAVAAAEKLIGVPYVWGGASVKGVDCSGLVMLAWASAGISLEHGATAMWEESRPVQIAKLQPGDLLFYHFADDGGFPITHVVMYVGSGPFGAETVIQAASPGTLVAFSPIYFSGFVAAGRP